MKKGLFLIPVAGAVAAVVALAVNTLKPWSWDNTAKSKQINYCLLIGQTDHNDSAARTGGIRNALGTRPRVHETNANIETPKQGKMTFYNNKEKSIKVDEYTVNELEHRVCISDSGATWDQQTAINVSNTWYAKYPNKLTMMVSNNDGMAEGALFSSCRPDGMPIFGYDSNESTLKLINKGKITGTINSNAPAQSAIMNIIARRIVDGVYNPSVTGGSDIYNTLFKGLKIFQDDGAGKMEQKGIANESEANDFVRKKGDKMPTGKESTGFMTDILGNDVDVTYKPECHALLVSSTSVTKHNVDDFLDEKKENAKSAKYQAEHSNTVSTPVVPGKKYEFYQCFYSQTDTYLNSTMRPLLQEFRKQFNIDDSDLSTLTQGNGNDEDEIVTSIKQKDPKSAYLINMVKTVDANKIIEAIYTRINNDEQYKKTPIIFFNRQPTKQDNTVDPTYMLSGQANHYNPYVFYVGFDAEAGADLQGKMIQEWLIDQIPDAGYVEVE